MLPQIKITKPAPERLAASCLDPGKPPALDLAALSAGRPDGVYFAGQRLAPWMPFDDRIKLSTWEYRPLREPRHEEAYRALKRRRETESLVVRWEIDGGLPSTPAELWDTRGADYDHELRSYAYLWGRESGHVDIYRLGHRLLRDALDSAGRESTSTNAYINSAMSILDALPQEGVWVLPARDLVQIAARVDLRHAARMHMQALTHAVKVEVCTPEELARLALLIGDE